MGECYIEYRTVSGWVVYYGRMLYLVAKGFPGGWYIMGECYIPVVSAGCGTLGLALQVPL
jgi:hypothetical protein